MARPRNNPGVKFKGHALRMRRMIRGYQSAESLCVEIRKLGLELGSTTVTSWERGEHKPPAEYVRALARVLKCKQGDFGKVPVMR